MKGYVYIASAFETVNRSGCGQTGSWVDNDPHFWTDPPIWGICRYDFRASADVGDFVFFVLPRRGKHPQMIFGYLRVEEKISHVEAFSRPSLRSKRMGNKIPNGNIIVDAKGRYNRFDGGSHKHKFGKIKMHYVIGDQSNSRILSAKEIRDRAPEFPNALSAILGVHGERAIDIISRKGRVITDEQAKSLLAWLNSPKLAFHTDAPQGSRR